MSPENKQYIIRPLIVSDILLMMQMLLESLIDSMLYKLSHAGGPDTLCQWKLYRANQLKEDPN